MPGRNAKRASVTGPADPTPPDLGPVMRISAGRNIGRCALAPLSRGGSGDEGREHLRGHGEVNMLFSQRPLRPAILRSHMRPPVWRGLMPISSEKSGDAESDNRHEGAKSEVEHGHDAPDVRYTRPVES